MLAMYVDHIAFTRSDIDGTSNFIPEILVIVYFLKVEVAWFKEGMNLRQGKYY